MSASQQFTDYTDWDWLPAAATEVETYLKRLLDESAITAHDVTARAKSIASFNRKMDRKSYSDPKREVTDTVAVRIITYSITDRNRAAELIRGRFHAYEDRNPGAEKDDDHRGYDCQHFVVQGELQEVESGWLVSGGHLARYFESFGGLEIQIRTVAAHAWAEFEHSRRYKGLQYQAISDEDRATLDIMFGAAADARRALDEAFIVIDRILARPTHTREFPEHETYHSADDDIALSDDEDANGQIEVNADSLDAFLAARFPADKKSSDEGLEFACDLVAACNLNTIGELEAALDVIEGDKVRELMDTSSAVTRVRRLDDELLARFGEVYIEQTKLSGNVKTRDRQLEWRYDRLRNKVPFKYNLYELVGGDSPEELRGRRLPAARAVRELTRAIADLHGPESVCIEGEIAQSASSIQTSARSKEVDLKSGDTLWIATNRDRDSSEYLLNELLDRASSLDITVQKAGIDLRTARPRRVDRMSVNDGIVSNV